jgi:hypothetical protein
MVKVFDYLEQIDCFVITCRYKYIATILGLNEWHESVWIGRYFALDNDYGEHWFDNWDLRDKISYITDSLGLDPSDIFIVDPDKFMNGMDGPSHPAKLRKKFWTDVLSSFQLSFEMLFEEARHLNEERKQKTPDEYIDDLEWRIENLRIELNVI